MGAIEEATAEADTTEEREVKTVTMRSQTNQSGVTKTSETGSDSINIPLFSLRMFMGILMPSTAIQGWRHMRSYCLFCIH